METILVSYTWRATKNHSKAYEWLPEMCRVSRDTKTRKKRDLNSSIASIVDEDTEKKKKTTLLLLPAVLSVDKPALLSLHLFPVFCWEMEWYIMT